MLQIEDVSSGYGQIAVLHNIQMKVDDGELVSLVGANGAGKSTLLRTIFSLLKCQKGRIVFDNQEISSFPPYKLAGAGLVHVPEGRQVFAPLTVYENLLLGTFSKRKKLSKIRISELFEYVYELFPILFERKNQLAGTLSGGEQQALAISRALMSEPKMLLIDEFSLGLAPIVVKHLCNVLKELNQKGLTILLVEQNVSIALDLAQRAYVLHLGKITHSGQSEELIGNEEIKRLYLGEAR